MEKPPVNPVSKVELPKTEQQLEHFSFSEQEKNIQEVFKLSPELENIAIEATKSGETISLYRIENKNIEKEPDGITSHKDLKGQWFSPDLETALVYLRKSQQTFGAEAKRVEGANLVVVKVSKEEFENLHVSKHPIASQMDVENDNYIIPENIERNYINLDDVQDKVGNFENLQKAKEQIKEKVKQFETKEAVELYCAYLKTIFPESKVQDILWHGSFNHGFDDFSKEALGKATRAESAKTGFFFTDSFELAKSYVTLTQEHGELNEKQKLLQQTYQLNASKRGELDEVFKNTSLYKSAEEIGNLYTGGDYMPVLDKLMEIGFTARFTDKKAIEIKPLGEETSQKLAKEALNISDADFVYPVILDMKNPKVFDDKEQKYREETYKERLDNTISENKDSTIIYNTFDPGLNNVHVVFDPSQIHILGSKTDIEKFKEFVSKKENSFLEKQELYKKIRSEIESVSISENDKDKEGNLLAPNGKKSNLPELEWKMARTPSFSKFFGNWKEKYNKEQYDLWLKYQEKQTCEDYIKRYQEHKESQKNQSLQALENIRTGEYSEKEKWEKYHLDHIKEYDQFYQKDIIRLSQRISKLQAELINSGFNTHSYDLDYTKVLDENGEPLLLYRGTDFTPDENGKFVIPKKKIDGNEFEVGVFFGNEEEAKHHHEGRKIEGKTSKLYKVFVNGRNFKIFDSKPNYWANPKDSQEWRGKYDGVWVKQNENQETRTDTKVNLFDYIAFNPDDVLIVDVE